MPLNHLSSLLPAKPNPPSSVEASYSGLPNVDGNAWCPNGTAVCRTEIENLLLNDRVGFELGTAMLYASGGWARSTVNVRRVAAVATDDDGHLSGWDFGGGIEFMMWPNVVFGVEYLHVDYADGGFCLANTGVLWRTSASIPTSMWSERASLCSVIAGAQPLLT